MTTDAAGPREQAIRDRLKRSSENGWYEHWFADDIRDLLSLLDALRPEEPPPQTEWDEGDTQQVRMLKSLVHESRAEVASLRQQLEGTREQLVIIDLENTALESEVASLRAQLTEEQKERAAYKKGLEECRDAWDKSQAQLTEAQQARELWKVAAEREVSAGKAAEATLASLRQAARIALDEMCNTVAPRNSFTDAVDKLDAALAGAGPTPTQEPTPLP